MAAEPRIGGITTQRTRTPRKKLKQRRQYKGVVRGGFLTIERGAFVVTLTSEGDPSEPVWDATLRLYANLGDSLLLCGEDIVAVKIIGITERGRIEDWKISPVVPDGKYIVMKGPKT